MMSALIKLYVLQRDIINLPNTYLIIIPLARMGYWLRGHKGERKNCFIEIQLVGQKYRE